MLRAVLQRDHLAGEALGDGFVRIEDVLGQIGALVGLGDVTEVGAFLGFGLLHGVTGHAGGFGEDLLSERHVAFFLQNGGEGFFGLQGHDLGRFVLDLLDAHGLRGAFGGTFDIGIGIIQRGEHFGSAGHVLGGADGVDDELAVLRIGPALVERLLRELDGLRTARFAVCEVQQRGIRIHRHRPLALLRDLLDELVVVFELRRVQEGVEGRIVVFAGVRELLERLQRSERGGDALGAVGFREGDDGLGERHRSDAGTLARSRCSLGLRIAGRSARITNESHQQRHRLRWNLLRASHLRRQLRQHLRVLLREFEDALLRLVELDAVAVQFLHQEGRFLRRGLRQRVLQCHGDLWRLAPGFRLVIRPPRVRPRAPRIALPLAFFEMKAAQRREDALAQRRISGLAETLDEGGDDFGTVNLRTQPQSHVFRLCGAA